ncbi:MAG: zinc-binding dehydrogenase [SAR202 cluster bacterium]|nr:zinc-binding dehydrogenase [SAR202 cluster bacterium]
MKRLLITGPRKAVFEEAPIPACPRDGLLVRANLTSVSTGTELRVYRFIPVDTEGKFMHANSPFDGSPQENGYSMVGEVVEAGAEVKGFAAGDRVFVPGSHKEYAALPARLAVKLPERVPDEHAVLLNILGVGHIALRDGSPDPGANVAMLGLGVIGLSALAYCAAFSMRSAAIDFSEARLAIARKMGATVAISPKEPDFRKRVLDLFDGQGADVVIEAASSWAAIQTSLDIARKDGKVVVAARHTDIPTFNAVGHPYLNKRVSIRTSYGNEPDGSRWDRNRSMALTLDLMTQGRLPFQPMVTHTFKWSDLPEVYARLDRGDTDIVGTIIRWR